MNIKTNHTFKKVNINLHETGHSEHTSLKLETHTSINLVKDGSI